MNLPPWLAGSMVCPLQERAFGRPTFSHHDSLERSPWLDRLDWEALRVEDLRLLLGVGHAQAPWQRRLYADGTFWALYNGEPEKVVCTLHWIDAGIDTGGLVAHVSPKVLPDDDEPKLFWRAVQTSTGVYAELLQRLAAGERFGQTQPHKGRLYQVKQRGLTQERVVGRRLQEGLLKGLDLDVRVTWFAAGAAAQ